MNERYSELDKTHKIKQNRWVISLVRNLSSKNQQHALIILEGIKQNKHCIYFVDFVGKPHLPNSKSGRVRLEYFDTDIKNEKTNLIYKCKRRMLAVKPGDKLCYKSYYIKPDLALEWIDSINKLRENNSYPFCILGKKSILTQSSARSSSKEKGHNCFTWAREQLNSIDDNNIYINATKLENWVLAATSVTLPSKNPSCSERCFSFANKYPKATLFATSMLVGVVGTLMLYTHNTEDETNETITLN